VQGSTLGPLSFLGGAIGKEGRIMWFLSKGSVVTHVREGLERLRKEAYPPNTRRNRTGEG